MDKEKLTQMAKYRSKLKDLYGSEILINERSGSQVNIKQISDVLTKDPDLLYNNALKTPKTAYKLSEAAYYASNQYASIINYYKTFFYIRYTVIPYKIKKGEEKIGQEALEYDKIYSRMIGAVEGINLETLLPSILEYSLIYGSCGVITEKNTSSESIVTFILPQKYYKQVGKTQIRKKIIAFNFEYFDMLKNKVSGSSTNAVEDTTFESVLNSFPKILRDGYAEYLLSKANKWKILNPEVATMFTFNDIGLPPKLGAYPAAVDYNQYKSIELDAAEQKLDKILSHQIPTDSNGNLIMEVDEAIDISSELRKSLASIPNVKVITTFGPTELHDLSSSRKEEMDVINQAYQNIYSSAGVDYHIFYSDKDLEATIKRDKAFVWDFLQTVMLFYNVTINNLINFKPYQAKINLLPISVQLEDKDVQRYIEYAGAGIGRLQAVVAAGIKQIDLESLATLEEYLDLDTILKPLQSMYTSSYRVNQRNANEEEEEESNKTLKDTEETQEV